MRFRTFAGTFVVLGIGFLVYLDSVLLTNTRPLGSLLLVFLGVLGWKEFARMTGIDGHGPRASSGLGFLGMASVIYFFAVAWVFGGCFPGGVPAALGREEAWTSGGLFALVVGAFTLVIFRREFERFYPAVLETVVGAILLGLFFSYVLRIYHLPGWKGPVLGLVFVAGVKGNDTVAYYVGKTWGRIHFLKVSPRKTLEGCIGALVFSTAYFALAAVVVEAFQPGSLFPWPSGILVGMIISIVSQIGDLGESLVKRVYQVKDSGALLSEFGGALDMIDSLLFTGFIFWEFH